jgi:hypothetical protein
MRPTSHGTVEDTTGPHDCIRSLPGAEEFPLWRIGCRVHFMIEKIEDSHYLTVF